MDRRTLLFVAISVLILVGYQEFVLKQIAPGPPAGSTPPPNVETTEAIPYAQEPARNDAPILATNDEPPTLARDSEQKKIAAKKIRVETDLYIATFTTAGGRLEDFRLKQYRETNDPESPLLSLVHPAPEIELPLGIELYGAQRWRDRDQEYTASLQNISLSGEETRSLTLETTFGGETITKTFTFRGNEYPIELYVETPAAQNLPPALSQATPEGRAATVGLLLTRAQDKEPDGASFEGPAVLMGDDLVQTAIDDLEAPEVLQGPVVWAGFEDHYFLLAAAPERAVEVRLLRQGQSVEEKVLTPRAANGPTNLTYTLYLGPKDRQILESAGHGFNRGLNLGWFAPVALILLYVLEYCNRFTGNWGADIILLTLLVKIIFWPLSKKSFTSMRAMQKLQPEMAKLKEKYKDDAQKMNTETMELYKRHKVNPLGGCLPMLLQMPVFLGLYNLLQNTIQLRHAPFVLWITDLAAPERLPIGLDFSIPFIGNGIPVLTLLLGASMFLQQKLSPQAADPMQQRIMMLMPVVFTAMFINFPAGLTLYWLTNNVLTIGQQWWMLRQAPS